MLYLDYQNDKYLLDEMFWGISGWYVSKSSHLQFLKLSSTNRPSISSGKTCLSICLLGMSSRMQIINHTPFQFLSSLYGSGKPFTKNCAVCCKRIMCNCSNLFRSEFMLRFPIIILFRFLVYSFLVSNNRFGEVSLVNLLLVGFLKLLLCY